jgi:hypothetical protein
VSYRPLAEGMTRNCLDPWASLNLGRDKIDVCCQINTLPVEGSGEQAFRKALVSDTLRQVRRGLLEGRPVEECAKCRLRQAIPAGELRKQVNDLHDLFALPAPGHGDDTSPA